MHANVLTTVTVVHHPMNFLTDLQEKIKVSHTVITGLNFPETAGNYISQVPICVLYTLYSHARSAFDEP